MKNPKDINESGYPAVFLTIWQDAGNALISAKSYVLWALQPFKRSVVFLLYLQIFVSIIWSIFFMIKIKPQIIEIKEQVRERFPEVTLKNNNLSIENDQTFVFTDSDSVFIKVDPLQSLEDNPSIDTFYENGVLVLKDGFYLLEDGEVEQVLYDWPDFYLNAEIVSDAIDKFLVASYVIVPLLIFIASFLFHFFVTAFFAVLFWFFSRTKYNLVHLWSMGIYATVPAMVAHYIEFIFFPTANISMVIFLIYYSVALYQYQRIVALEV